MRAPGINAAFVGQADVIVRILIRYVTVHPIIAARVAGDRIVLIGNRSGAGATEHLFAFGIRLDLGRS